jgi:hypothetical protein
MKGGIAITVRYAMLGWSQVVLILNAISSVIVGLKGR